MTERLKSALDRYAKLTYDPMLEETEGAVAYLAGELGESYPIAYVESFLSWLKSEKVYIENAIIPEELNNADLESIELKDGRKVAIETIYDAKVKNKEAFYSWLESQGAGAIVKKTFDFAKGEDLNEVKELLESNGIAYEESATVHHQSMKAFIKKHIADGGELPPEEAATVTIFEHAKIKS